MKTISIIGCGWLGLPLAQHFIKKGYQVKGSTTTPQKLPILAQNGIQAYLLHLEGTSQKSDIKNILKGTDTLIINFPPKRIEDVQESYPSQVHRLAEGLSSHQKVIFVSSTSVYQNTNGLVTEQTDPMPEKGSGKAILKAEGLLREQLQKNLTILRLAGLIGYDRLAGRFLAGKKGLDNAHAPVNVIHRDDCIGIIEQIVVQEKWGEIYNGCASQHPTRKTFYTQAALEINLPPPEFIEEDESFFKIIDNNKVKTELGYVFKHPDPMQVLGNPDGQ